MPQLTRRIGMQCLPSPGIITHPRVAVRQCPRDIENWREFEKLLKTNRNGKLSCGSVFVQNASTVNCLGFPR